MNKNAHLAFWAFVGIACCFSACGDNDEAAGISELAANQFTDPNEAVFTNLDCLDAGFDAEGIGTQRIRNVTRACLRTSTLCKTYDAGNSCKINCSKLAKSPCRALSPDENDQGHCKWDDHCTKSSYKPWKFATTCDRRANVCVDL
ncbi:MAG: hypothetical protein AAF320_02065 [Myxococcota bacterium]